MAIQRSEIKSGKQKKDQTVQIHHKQSQTSTTSYTKALINTDISKSTHKGNAITFITLTLKQKRHKNSYNPQVQVQVQEHKAQQLNMQRNQRKTLTEYTLRKQKHNNIKTSK